MSVGSDRRLLGLLLLWALVPFPFLYIVVPPFWLAAAAAGLYMVFKPAATPRFSRLALNLIGVAIIVVVVVAGGLRVGPLRPLGHLLLLLTSVRVLMVSDRRSFLRATLMVFLVWVVAITSSTHVVVALYFGASAVLWWWVGIRVHLAGLGFELEPGVAVPRHRHVVVAAMLALLLSVPIFVALPRLRSPWVAGRGGVSSVTGFTSHVDLAGVGTIRQSQQLAMVVRSTSGEPIRPEWMRLRATALQRVTINSWAPRGAIRVPESRNGLVWPHGTGWRLADAVELEIELLRPRRYLFLPYGTVALSSPVELRLDPSGGVALASRMRGPLTYTVWVARGEAPRLGDPPSEGPPRFELDPQVRQLAMEVAGDASSDTEKALAIESYLKQNFGYSLIGMTHQRADPVSWFLLQERQGHCEYFAGAMVALLNGFEVPARMVAGFSGGSLSADGDEASIRDANAHAWVEAWVGENGSWTVFDPTPEADIPALNRPSARDRLRWTVDWIQSSWDRYVLTFGFGEQVQLVTAMANGIDALLRRVSWVHLFGAAFLVVLSGTLWWMARRGRSSSPRAIRRAPGPAAMAVDRVARRLEQSGVSVPPQATIRWIAARARDLWPAAGSAIGELSWLAERELYTVAGPRFSDGAVVRALWLRARRGMRQAAAPDEAHEGSVRRPKR
jgi:transglutaminase-like putative cysteine protease